jgi:Na+/H+ antiporter NhaB
MQIVANKLQAYGVNMKYLKITDFCFKNIEVLLILILFLDGVFYIRPFILYVYGSI